MTPSTTFDNISFRHRHGYEGAADASIAQGAEKGELFDLGVMGFAEGLPTGFPRALLGLTSHRSEDLLRGTVVGRFSIFKAKVQLDDGPQVEVFVSNTYLTPGTRVLLHSKDRTRPTYVGALAQPPPLVGSGSREMSSVSVTARVTEHLNKHALATSESAGIEIFLPSGAYTTEIGGGYLVALVGSGRDAEAPFVGHLASSRLPGNY